MKLHTMHNGNKLSDFNFAYIEWCNGFRCEIPVKPEVVLSVVKSSYHYSGDNTFEVGVVGLFDTIQVVGWQTEQQIWEIYDKVLSGTFERTDFPPFINPTLQDDSKSNQDGD